MKWLERASWGEIRYRVALWMIDRAISRVMPYQQARMWADWIKQAAEALKSMDRLGTQKKTFRFTIRKAGAYR